MTGILGGWMVGARGGQLVGARGERLVITPQETFQEESHGPGAVGSLTAVEID